MTKEIDVGKGELTNTPFPALCCTPLRYFHTQTHHFTSANSQSYTLLCKSICPLPVFFFILHICHT